MNDASVATAFLQFGCASPSSRLASPARQTARASSATTCGSCTAKAVIKVKKKMARMRIIFRPMLQVNDREKGRRYENRAHLRFPSLVSNWSMRLDSRWQRLPSSIPSLRKRPDFWFGRPAAGTVRRSTVVHDRAPSPQPRNTLFPMRPCSLRQVSIPAHVRSSRARFPDAFQQLAVRFPGAFPWSSAQKPRRGFRPRASAREGANAPRSPGGVAFYRTERQRRRKTA
jgi:hypothetical protein